MRAWLVVVTLALAATTAGATPTPKPPCSACTLDVPAKHDGAMPLVVLLHGDRQRATTLASWWRKPVADRGWALLSLQCPTELKCVDSWWQWDGDPGWVAAQVDAVAKANDIDRSRVYLVGWSGGASYMGDHAEAWTAWFAAIVIHGGGIPPAADACPSPALPAYFLVGDKNPLHKNAILLRDYFDACKQDVVWDLVAGADHDKEERALTAAKATAILDWLASRPAHGHS